MSPKAFSIGTPGRRSGTRGTARNFFARSRGVKPTEGYLILRGELAVRDGGWVCQVCAEPIDGTLRFPDPRSCSIDHIVPVSAGEPDPHRLSNLQLAHLGCNSRKRVSVADSAA